MTLAIHGGPPVRTRPFPRWPQFGDAERAGLLRVLEQGDWWRMGGGEVRLFEREFAAFHGAIDALGVTNGTHALELALQVCGVGPGDEVLVPAFTFVATSLAVQRVGAVPVPVDTNPFTYCMDPAATAASITPRTKAVLPVHVAGHMADLDALLALPAARGISLIQDAAHAHGATWRDHPVGEFDTMAAFSFQNGKLMTAGEGGLLLFPSEDLREEAFLRHNAGRSAADRQYRHERAGSNYRMGEFTAAVLRGQLLRLPSQLRRREERAADLDARLAGIDGVMPQGRDPRCTRHSHYMAMFRLDPDRTEGVRRNDVVEALFAEGIPAFVGYPPVYRTSGYWEGPAPAGPVRGWAERCQHAERIGSESVWVHHRVLLGTVEDVDDVAEAVYRVLRELRPSRSVT